MTRKQEEKISALLDALHGCPELSGRESGTMALLEQFLRENTSLRLTREDGWLRGERREGEGLLTLAFRADMDALPDGRGGAAHLCGHDGHCAALCALALALEGERVGKNLLFLFQSAEETGEGGRACADYLRRAGADCAFAVHNIPGQPEGTVLLRRGTFACASTGLAVSLAGTPTHAAYPEAGRNPMYAAAELVTALPALTARAAEHGMVLATPVGELAGERAYGKAASAAELCLTLRAERTEDLEKLLKLVREETERLAERDGLAVSFQRHDPFPACVGEDGAVELLARAAGMAGLPVKELPEPFRWSEDFGWCLRAVPGAMAGIGDGEDWPQLHTAEFTCNRKTVTAAEALFEALCRTEFGRDGAC